MSGIKEINLPENLKPLSVEDRLQLIETIWDSISNDPEKIPLTDSQRQELDRRKIEHEKDPAAAKPWSEIKARLQGRRV